MSPSNPEKPPQIVFRGDPDKWSDARNTIELYLRALDPPLIGYLQVENYDGTQTFTLHPPIREPAAPAVPPSTTSDSGGGGDDDPEGGHRKKKKKRSQQLTLDPNGGSVTVFREMSKVTLVIHQCMDENIRLLINAKKPFDAWKILNDRYGTAEAVDRVRLFKEINAFKLNVGVIPGIFVAKLDVLLDRYEQATGTVHGDMGRSLMLREKLPSDWDSLVQSWHGQKNVIPYQQLRGLVERQKVTPVATTPRKETALKATTGDPRRPAGRNEGKRGCFNCHQQGHDAVDCPDLSQAERDKRRADVEAWRAQKAERDKNKKAKGKPSPKPRQPDRFSLTKEELANIINNTAKEAASEVEKRLQRDNRRLESDSDRDHRRDDRNDRRGHCDRSPGRRGHSRSRAHSRSPRRESDYRRHESERNRETPRRSRSPDHRSSFSPGDYDRKDVQRALFAHASVQRPYTGGDDEWRKDKQVASTVGSARAR
jgi:hypothetical protein